MVETKIDCKMDIWQRFLNNSRHRERSEAIQLKKSLLKQSICHQSIVLDFMGLTLLNGLHRYALNDETGLLVRKLT